jgi:hypothetical protein
MIVPVMFGVGRGEDDSVADVVGGAMRRAGSC